jgi:hypothetical protein
MKIFFFILLVGTTTQKVFPQKTGSASNHKQHKVRQVSRFPDFKRSLLLEAKPDTTANISFGDLNGDGHLDILLVKGRHWPIVDRVLIGDGRGSIRKAYNLGKLSDRSYTGGLADFNGDGFLDIAVSNDDPDRKLIYFNDGKGNFTVGSEFGIPGWPTRNISITDINADGLKDIVVANRSDSAYANYVCLNRGKGQFDADCMPFAHYPATTISPADVDNDGFIDLVVPHRDGGQGYVYLGSPDTAFSDARRIPFGPSDAHIRMAAVSDFNADTMPDIVAIDENKGVTLYFGQKDKTFSTGIAIEDATAAPYALAIADLNNDKKADIIVGHVEAPSSIFFNDGTGRHFEPVPFGDSKGTVYGFAVGDFNEDGTPDIAAARSDAQNVLYFGSIKPIK